MIMFFRIKDRSTDEIYPVCIFQNYIGLAVLRGVIQYQSFWKFHCNDSRRIISFQYWWNIEFWAEEDLVDFWQFYLQAKCLKLLQTISLKDFPSPENLCFLPPAGQRHSCFFWKRSLFFFALYVPTTQKPLPPTALAPGEKLPPNWTEFKSGRNENWTNAIFLSKDLSSFLSCFRQFA